jgi:hypothetical protein
VFEAAERQLGAPSVAAIRAKLPPRLSAHASLDRLRASAAMDTVPLNEGVEILLSVDALLGDGSGKLIENIGVDLASRMLSQGGSVVRSGDLAGTVARLQAFLEHPFVAVPLVFELRRNLEGFSLTVGVTGQSRATRVLRHLTVGAIVAAERFAREVGANALTVLAENVSDRSNIIARYLPIEEPVAEEAPQTSRRPAPWRAPMASLSAEVERILRSSVAPRSHSEPTRPAGVPAPERPSIAEAPPRPSAPRLPVEDPQSPISETMRVASVPAARGPAIK